jgi:hypothetical protein
MQASLVNNFVVCPVTLTLLLCFIPLLPVIISIVCRRGLDCGHGGQCAHQLCCVHCSGVDAAAMPCTSAVLLLLTFPGVQART